MKNIILISIFLMLTSGIFANTQIDDVFEDAVASFELKDYSKALDRFKSIENEGIISADLFYNIGNCYFRLNEVGRSILYFKKALKVKSNHEAARRNLKYSLTFTKDKQGSGSEDVIKSFWEKAFEALSINLLALISIIIFSLIILLIVLMIIRYHNREKTVPAFITVVLTVFLVLFLVLSFLKWKEYHNEDEAVLLSSSAIGYSGPSEDFTRVFTIHEGMIFQVEREESGWCLIKLANGLGGWIETDTFERIKL